MGAGGGARLKVTIVGAGNMGRGIGRRIVAGGNEVELVDRNPEDSRTLAGDLGGLAASSRRVTGDVVVLALPYEERWSPSTRRGSPGGCSPWTSDRCGVPARSNSAPVSPARCRFDGIRRETSGM